jgi:CRISPR-associated protein Csb2
VEAFAVDVRAECRRIGLPDPRIESRDVHGVSGSGLVGYMRLTFSQNVSGPLLLGKTRHFGGGLFRPVDEVIR